MPTLTATRRKFAALRVRRVTISGRDHLLPTSIEPNRNPSGTALVTAASGPQYTIGRWVNAGDGLRPALPTGSGQWGVGGFPLSAFPSGGLGQAGGVVWSGGRGMPMAAPWRLPVGLVMVASRPDCPWW